MGSPALATAGGSTVSWPCPFLATVKIKTVLARITTRS